MSRIEDLEKRLAADPNSRMFVQLAEEYRKARLLEQAIEVCEKGLKKHPGYPSARVALGRALLEAGSFDRARTEFEAVLKQVPDNILAIKFLGETYHRLGRFDEALQKYLVARTLAPEDNELEGKMQEVQAEMAGGPKPADAPPPPPPPPPVAAPPTAPRPAAAAAPPVSAPRHPPPRPVTAPPPVQQPPPIEPAPHEEEAEVPASDRDDLPPIPLVEVNEPMILEDRFSDPRAWAEAPPPPTLVPPPRMVEPPRAEVKPPAPPAAAAAPAATPVPAASVAEIQTPTMAEIYASQGHFHQAISVYQKLLERNPAETKYRQRIDELIRLSSPGATGATGADQKTIQALEQWLEAIRKSKGA